MLIALDSNVFIAALAGSEPHSRQAQQLIRDVAAGKHKAIASSIIYGEVLGLANREEADIERFFAAIPHLVTIPADDGICLAAAQLRRRGGGKLKLPDALHIATALMAGAEVFITNDKSLSRQAQKLVPAKSLAEVQ